MKRLAITALASLALLGGAPAAEAGTMRYCGNVATGEWAISADSRTTTCALARSAGRSFIAGDFGPYRIYGSNGRTYTLLMTRQRNGSARGPGYMVYRGYGGLRVRFTYAWND